MELSRFAAAALGGGAILLSAAHAENRTFDLPNFNRIDISAGVHLVAEVGGPQSVEVRTEHGDFSDFEIKVRNGELIATRKQSRLRWHNKKSDYKVVVTLRDLNGIEASSGSWGKIANIDAGNFDIDISSGANLNLEGECGSCTLDISSGANLVAEELSCGDAVVDVSSGGHGVINVRDRIVADASSGGHVRVNGNPEKVNIDKSSGGRIKIVK